MGSATTRWRSPRWRSSRSTSPGTLYTIGSDSEVLNTLSKAARLLLIPALIPLMRDVRMAAARHRRVRGVDARHAGPVVPRLVRRSCRPLSGSREPQQDPVAFKAHITHNVFMAFAAFLFALAAVDAKTRRGADRAVRALCGRRRQRAGDGARVAPATSCSSCCSRIFSIGSWAPRASRSPASRSACWPSSCSFRPTRCCTSGSRSPTTSCSNGAPARLPISARRSDSGSRSCATRSG